MENTDPSKNGPCLDTVKALHQTIVSLRTALEQSKTEILHLKQRAWPAESVQDCLSALTIENHVLKAHLLNKQGPCCLGKEVFKKTIKNVGTETNCNNSCLEKKRVSNKERVADKKSPNKINDEPSNFETNNRHNIDSFLGNTANINKEKTVPKGSKYETESSDSDITKSFLKLSSKKNLKQSHDSVKINIVPEVIILSNTEEIEQQNIKTNSVKEIASNRGDTDERNLQGAEDKDNRSFKQSNFQDIEDNDLQFSEEKDFQSPRRAETEFEENRSESLKIEDSQPLQESKQTNSKSSERKEDLQHFEDQSRTEKTKCPTDEPNQKAGLTTEEVAINEPKKVIEEVEDPCKGTEVDFEDKVSIITDNISPQKISTSLENLSIFKSPQKNKNRNLSISKTISFSNIADLKKTVKFYDRNSEIIVIKTEDLNNFAMTENTPTKLANSKNVTEPLNKIESLRSASSLPKSVSHPTVSSSSFVSHPTSAGDLNSRPPSTQNTELLSESKSIQPSETSEINNYETQLKETTEDDSLNIFEDSASSPSTIKERSLKPSISDDTNPPNNYKQHESHQNMSPQSELGQNDEVDDIELIFTTDETKESDFKEQLVPIESNENMQHLQCPGNDTDQNLSFEISDRELDDDVFNEGGDSSKCFECNSQMYNSKSDNSINHEEKSLKSCYSCQDSSFENKSFEKEESFDQFEDKVRIIETDISKCGIFDVDYAVNRRNTCPNPLPYRPIIHREAVGKGLNIRKGRPILGQSSTSRRDSGAQTDISALPNSFWRSESSLAHKVKVGENFATLPSKLPLPCSRIKLSEKTVEARRVLLSDIGFTSMVPELSRSADHLGPDTLHTPTPVQYGQFLRTTDLYSPGLMSQRFNWTTTVSPMEMSRSQSRYSSIYPLSPPAPSRRCSAPVSPSRRPCLRQTSKVRFANGSLPELRVDWASTGDSGDSTDSLVEEAENFLRRSIDCLTSKGDYHRVKGSRRASAPEPSRDSIPLDWQPFLPRTPHDLRHEHWVKVIVPGEGKVRGGRVRYVGPVAGQSEQYVGVQLSTPDGHSDGVFHNRRYFSCEPHHAVFVPFKKVIMGWKP